MCLLSALAAILAPTKLPPFTLPFNIATCIVFICLRGRGLVGVPPDEAAGTPDGDTEVEWDQVNRRLQGRDCYFFLYLLLLFFS